MNKNEQLFKHSSLVKGYNYEREIWDILDLSGIVDYESNPIIFREWVKHTNRGYDILIPLFGYPKSLRVECKFTSKPIFHSWFMRDWFSRDCHIIVTNNKFNVPYADRQLLREKGIKLFNSNEFYNYLFKLGMVTNSIFEYYKYKRKSDKRSKIKSRTRQKDYGVRLKLFLKLIKTIVLLENRLNVKREIEDNSRLSPRRLFSLFTNSLLSIYDKSILIRNYKEICKK